MMRFDVMTNSFSIHELSRLDAQTTRTVCFRLVRGILEVTKTAEFRNLAAQPADLLPGLRFFGRSKRKITQLESILSTAAGRVKFRNSENPYRRARKFSVQLPERV